MVDAVAVPLDRVFTGGIGAMMLWGFGLFGIYFFTSLYLQNVLGFSPTKAGAAFVPMALCMAVVRRVWPSRSRPGSARTARWRAACSLMAAGLGACSACSASTRASPS